MCGIFGILPLGTEGVDARALARGAEALRHRGPDARTTWIDPTGRVGFAHARLSILDLSPAGNQPFATASGSVHVIANAEIYNYRELVRTLERSGRQLLGRNDCECLPHLYEVDGIRFLEHLDGMFAGALWDGARLLLFRDPFGKKPLYYVHQPGRRFAFASEIKALLPFLDERAVGLDAVLAYLARGYVVGETSVFREIRPVPPGSVLSFDPRSGMLAVEAVPRRSAATPDPDADPGVWITRFRDAFFSAVEKRLMADVPLGAFLSGGIDSSAVVAAMSRLLPGAERHTFSVHFGEPSFDSDDHVDAIARRYGLRHHRVWFRAKDFVERFEPVMAGNDELLADLSLLPMHELARSASRELRVVLTGDGADELLGGYDTYRATQLARLMGPARRAAAPLLRAIALRLGPGKEHTKLNRSLLARQLAHGLAASSLPLAHASWRRVFGFDEVRPLLAPQWRERIAGREFPDAALDTALWDAGDRDWLARAQSVDVGTWLLHSILPKVDRSTMAYGLEARCPFLDAELASLCAALPLPLRLRHPKWVLRKAFEDELPAPVTWQKKQGFHTPLGRWFLEEPGRSFAEHWVTSDAALAHGFFDRDTVRRLFAEHGRRDCHLLLWNLMTFNAWAHAYEPVLVA